MNHWKLYGLFFLYCVFLPGCAIQEVNQKPSWNGEAFGHVPIGEWSESITIHPRCEFSHQSQGCGTDYSIRFRYYSPEWKEHHHGEESQPANEVQFMLLTKNASVPNFTLWCW